MLKITLMFAFAIAAGSCLADPQKTLGEALDAGATMLSKADIETQVIGAWFKFKGNNGSEFNLNPTPGGIVTGHVVGFRTTAPGAGTWKLSDDGKLCIDFHFAFGSMVGDYNRCSFWLGNAGRYWFSPSSGDRAAPAFDIVGLIKK